MATVRQYYSQLKVTRDAVATRMGVEASSVQTETRAMSNAVLACIAIIVKALTDGAVLTDAQLQAAQAAALAEIWDREGPPQQP